MTSQFRRLDVAVGAGLPFSRPIFLGNADQSSVDVVVVGMDGTLEPTSRVLEALSVFGASASKQVYKQSRLECNRRDGRKDVTPILHMTSEDGQASPLLRTKTTPIASLPVEGLECRLAEYCFRYANADVLKRKADEYISALDEQDAQAEKSKDVVKDSDGFILVKGPAAKSGVQALQGPRIMKANRFLSSTSLAPVSNVNKPKKRGGQEQDFYRFQIREQKKEEYVEMKRHQKEDEMIVEKMRRKKKFKLH